MSDPYIIKKSKKKDIKKARQLKQEDYYGMVEYKLKINDIIGTDRQEQIKTQMLFRLHQGEGKAVYNIGYQDDGYPNGVDYDLLLKSLGILHHIAGELNACPKSIKILLGKEGYCANIFLKKDDLCNDLLPEEADLFLT